ncbi:hypothetical protein ACFPH6_22890 [Streptomyces xiangluensis]|uniref:Uncharacterized protein n=1 Tax=Streptomyces xiangluensis TaxID=2665720 RepID=A0ABV8YTH4_9ACTN
MSVYIESMQWAARDRSALGPDHSLLSSDEPYTPQQPSEGNDLIEFFTSIQMILGLVVALVAGGLLVFSLWSSRREVAEDGEEREETG